jgi:hypothetical protein
MTEKVPFDEDSPFFSPSPTTTASDLLRIVEEVQENKRLFDSRLLAVLPNLVASYVIRSCEAIAGVEGRSGSFELSSSNLASMLPLRALVALDKGSRDNCELLSSCCRICIDLGKMVEGILTHLDFKCHVTVHNGIMTIEIAW